MTNSTNTQNDSTAGQSPVLGLAAGSASSHREAHLIGKPITVVYEIKDPTEWRKTNPLRYAHDGLEAYCVSIGDLAARRDALREALERVADEGDFDAREIARAALAADDAEG